MSGTSTPLAGLTPEQKRTLLARMLAEREQAQRRWPLSPAQRRLWFMARLQPDSTAYHIPAALKLDGALDVAALARALNATVARHDALRARFPDEDGEPWQDIRPHLQLDLAPVDIAREGDVAPALRALAAPPFDLAQDAPVRAQLLRLSPERHVLLLCLHHIVADYDSLRLLLKDIALLYGAPDTTLPPLPIRYVDYAVWQQSRAERQQAELDFWLRTLADPPPPLALPTDRPRPAVIGSAGGRIAWTLDDTLADAVRQCARRHNATVYAVLLAALDALLYRHTGQDDFLVGTTASNRERPETRELIGLFVNNLVLRARLDGDTPFDLLIARTRDTVLAAFAHQSLPFEQLVDSLRVERRLDRHPLFQIMCVLHAGAPRDIELPGLKLGAVDADVASTRFDLTLDLVDAGRGAMHGFIEYSRELFEPGTVRRFGEQLQTLLRAVLAQPSLQVKDIPLCAPDTRDARPLQGPVRALPAGGLAALFERARAAQPDRTAVECDGERLDYRTLHRRADALAAALRAHGVRPGMRVALCLPRGVLLPVALLACIKSGAVWVPLDPRQPLARLQAVVQDADCVLALTDGRRPAPDLACPLLHADAVADAAWHEAAPADDAVAYQIYTSGSTGTPKGVAITRAALANLLQSVAHTPGMTASDTLLALTTVSFDIALLELLLPLTLGARLLVADDDAVGDGARIAMLIRERAITHVQATPAGWQLLLDTGWQAHDGLTLLCGGEALPVALAARLIAGGAALWNMYGPTETTIWSAALPVTRARIAGTGATVPVGGPLDNTWLAVVDEAGRPVPPGVAGELLIGGLGLSPGYAGRPDLDAQRYIAWTDPAGHTQRACRTGDRVRRRADDSIEFLGRLDHQIKLRGFRIEPGDIEAAALAHDGVAQALAGLHAAHGQEPRLVLWLRLHAPAADHETLTVALRAHLSQRLPAYMLPSALVVLDAFPLNANGKIDRKALPPPDAQPHRAAGRPPQGDIECRLAALWSALLPQPVHSATDDFFELGGHSLLAARMIARVHKDFPDSNARVSLRALFERPTLAGFAALLSAPTPAAGTGPDRVGIAPADRSRPLPLSSAQQRQWVLAQLEPDSPFYNIPAALRVRGMVSAQRLQQALDALCARHALLRSAYPAHDGQPTVTVADGLSPRLEHCDLAPLPAGEREAAARAELERCARQPFDLAQPPLWRALLVSTGESEHVLMLVVHHILADAWSMGLLLRELIALYGGDALTPPPLQYADYAAWQRARDTAPQVEWWRRQLAGAPRLLELPTDFPRPAVQSSTGASVRFALPAAVRDAFAALARDAQATPFMAWLALFDHLLALYSGARDIVVGTPVGHRPHPDLDAIPGLFANTVALRTDLSGIDDFPSLLARVRGVALDAFAHAEAELDAVIDALALPRSFAHAPLFQVMFQWQPATPLPTAPDGLAMAPLPLDGGHSKFDLQLTLADAGHGLDARIDFRGDLFRRDTVEQMAALFGWLAQQIAAAPQRSLSGLSLQSPATQALARGWHATALDHDRGLCLHRCLEQQAGDTPHAPALWAGDVALDHAALHGRANALAHELIAAGIRPGDRVGLCMQRDAALVVALLAVLKTGAAYVPLDPAYPAARLAAIVDNAQPAAVLCNAGVELPPLPANCLRIESGLPAALRADAPQAMCRPEDVAYIIYTSGSTGQPKGVTIEHRQAVALIAWARQHFDADSLRGVLASTSICFDLSVFEIFVPLACGGAVVLARDVLQLPELDARDRVTLINTVPTAAAELLRLGPLPASVNTLVVAGEPVPPALVDAVFAQTPVRRMVNGYGPSEDTTYSTFADLAPGMPQVPIGRPIANSRAHVLDEHLRPVAPGMCGELYLAGEGVARGYWARPNLTAERFLPNPLADGVDDRDTLLYRSGDRVRLRADGTLDFLGRLDHQVKVRGFRIETGDVEAALLTAPGVRQAVVAVRGDDAGHRRLIAWVERDDEQAASAALRSHLRSRLPDFMLPSAFVTLPALPRLPNGKIDRAALPLPVFEPAASDDAPDADDDRAVLLGIWRGVLGRPDLRADDNFFEAGGDSILAIQAVARAREAGFAMAPRDVFLHGSVAALAAHCRRSAQAAQPVRAPLHGAAALTPAQQYFFDLALDHPAHWNQSLLLASRGALDEGLLAQALAHLQDAHDVLRARFERAGDGRWRQVFGYVAANATADVAAIPLTVIRQRCDDAAACIARHAEAAHASFDLARAPLCAVVLFDLDTPHGPVHRLFIACHHLLIDGVSWRILLQDLQALYIALKRGQPPAPPPRTASLADWTGWLAARMPRFEQQRAYWQAQSLPTPPLPRDHAAGDNTMRSAATVSVALDADATQRLLHDLPRAHRARIDELLLTALRDTMCAWSGHDALQCMLEGHGRTMADAGADDAPDLTRTLGWFTAFHPLRLARVDGDDNAAIRSVRAALAAVPDGGIGHGVLRAPGDDATLQARPEVRLNYLGQTDALFTDDAPFSPAPESTGRARHPEDARDVLFDVNALVARGQLHMHWSYGRRIHDEDTVQRLADAMLARLRDLLAHCLSGRSDGGLLPQDVPLMQLDAAELDALLDTL
ncbi:MAG: amino acid adenylation domain-containing protein [Methyloversatilis sp.]|jgi:amino acid adenylation domain-containing protein/non-ribosomal peptide synthase protein (TIGR01720 family)|nr:amino acid adenylation domain-containing protein [Methyloversatilis sp.]